MAEDVTWCGVSAWGRLASGHRWGLYRWPVAVGVMAVAVAGLEAALGWVGSGFGVMIGLAAPQHRRASTDTTADTGRDRRFRSGWQLGTVGSRCRPTIDLSDRVGRAGRDSQPLTQPVPGAVAQWLEQGTHNP